MFRLADFPRRQLHRCRTGWAVSLFVAVVLLGVQSWLYGHELDHLASGPDEGTCELCLIGGGSAHAHPAAAPALPLPIMTGEAPKTSPGAPLIAWPISGFQSRAPPVFTIGRVREA